MADREKVIRAIQQCMRDEGCNGCPYDGECARRKWAVDSDAMELLRERESTTYAYDEYITPTCQNCGFHPFAGYIPTLKWMEQRGYNYCPGCGRRIIKWEASVNA